MCTTLIGPRSKQGESKTALDAEVPLRLYEVALRRIRYSSFKRLSFNLPLPTFRFGRFTDSSSLRVRVTTLNRDPYRLIVCVRADERGKETTKISTNMAKRPHGDMVFSVPHLRDSIFAYHYQVGHTAHSR